MEITGAILRIAAVSAISLILSVLAMLVAKSLGVDLKDTRQRLHPKLLITAALFNLLFIVAVALVLWFWDHAPLRILGFAIDGYRLMFIALALAITLALALAYVWALHRKGQLKIGWAKDYFKTPNAGMWLGMGVLFIAALQEEIMFRGYFGFVLLPFGFYYALLISSLIFTIWHFLTNKVNLFQAIDWLLGGIMLFYIYWLSESIWVAAMVHFSRNLTNVLVFNIADKHSLVSYKEPISPRQKTLFTLLHSILMIVLGLLYFS